MDAREKTEAAREAAREAKAAKAETKEPFFSRAFGNTLERLSRAFSNTLERLSQAIAKKNYPYKMTTYNEQTGKYHIVGSRKTFAEAYNHPLGTHVVQTHATAGQMEKLTQQLEREQQSPGAAMRRVGVGYLVAGPVGAAIGAATGNREKWFPLPNPIITPKPPPEDREKSADIFDKD